MKRYQVNQRMSMSNQATGSVGFHATMLIVAGLAYCGLARQLFAEVDRPNILFFLTDDQRFDQLGCAGHEILQTPNMDRLARQGTRFNNMFVTTSICAASRASILTGLHERTHKFTFRTPPIARRHTDTSYPSLLRQAGYRTGFVGKFGVTVDAGVVAQMFDSYRPLNRNPYFKEQPDGSQRHITQIAADLAIEFLRSEDVLRSEDNGQPFCLSISFNAPHAEDNDKQDHYPWPKVVDGMYDDAEIPPPPLSERRIFERHPKVLKESLNRQRWFWRWDTPQKYQKNIRGYYRMISGVDHAMGRVLNELTDRGMDENTVVIFSSDNGYYLGSRGFAGKWSHYEQSLRVPLIVFDPRSDNSLRGRVVDEMALNIDIPATILELAGVAVPAGFQGFSLTSILSGQTPTNWRRDFFCEHLMHYEGGIPKWEGVRGEQWVYARYFQQQPVVEFLHDLRGDPNQLQNLARQTKHAEVLDQMRLRCDELRELYGGQYTPEKFPSTAREGNAARNDE